MIHISFAPAGQPKVKHRYLALIGHHYRRIQEVSRSRLMQFKKMCPGPTAPCIQSSANGR